MAQDSEDVKWLYKKLKNKGYNIGSEADFTSSLANSEDRKWYYNKAKGMGLNVGSEADFDGVYAPTSNTKKEKSEQVVLPTQQIVQQQVQQPAQPSAQMQGQQQATTSSNVQNKSKVPVNEVGDGLGTYDWGSNKLPGEDYTERAMEDYRINSTFTPKKVESTRDIQDNYADMFALTQEGEKVANEYAEAKKSVMDKYVKEFDKSKELHELASRYRGKGKQGEEQLTKEANDLFVKMYGNRIEDELKPYNDAYNDAFVKRYGYQIEGETGRFRKGKVAERVTELGKRIDDDINLLEHENAAEDRRDSGDGKRPSSQSSYRSEYDAYINAANGRDKIKKQNKNWHTRERSDKYRQNERDLKLLDNAKKLNSNSARMIEEAGKKGSSWYSALGRGLRDSVFDVDTWSFGVTELSRNLNIKNVAEKAERGEKLTKGEEALMDACVANMATEAYYSSDLSASYRAGQTTGTSIPFMLEFAVNPVAGAGNAFAKSVLKYGMKKFGTFASMAARRSAKVGARLVGDALAAGAMTATTGAPRVAAGTVERMTGDIQFDQNDKGELGYAGRENRKGLGEALARSYAGQFLENQSEMIFNPFKGTGGIVLGAIGKGFEKVGKRLPGVASGYERAMNWAANTPVAEVYRAVNNNRKFKEIMKATQFHGYPEEYMEEVYNNFANVALGEMSLDDATSLEQNLDTMYGLAPTSVAFAVLGVGMTKVRHDIERRRKKAYREFLGQLTEDDLRVVESLKDEWEARDYVKGVMGNARLTPEQKKAALRATYNRLEQLAAGQLRDEVPAVENDESDAYNGGAEQDHAGNYGMERRRAKLEGRLNADAPGVAGTIDGLVDSGASAAEVENVISGLDGNAAQDARDYYHALLAERGAIDNAMEEANAAADDFAKSLEGVTDEYGNVTTANYKDEAVNVLSDDGEHATIVHADGRKEMVLLSNLSDVWITSASVIVEDRRKELVDAAVADMRNRFSNHPNTREPEKGMLLWNGNMPFLVGDVRQNADGTVTVTAFPAVANGQGQMEIKKGSEPLEMTHEEAMQLQNDYYDRMDDANGAENGRAHVDNVSENGQENEGTQADGENPTSASHGAKGSELAVPNDSEGEGSDYPAGVQGERAENGGRSAMERMPKDEKGNPIYEQADAETAFDALAEQTGDAISAQEIAESMVKDKEAALKKLQKAKPKAELDVQGKIEEQKRRKAGIAKAQEELDKWMAIAAEPQRRIAAEERRRMDEEKAQREAARKAAEAKAKAEREEAAAKAGEQAERAEGAKGNLGRSLTKDEADELLSRMEEDAEVSTEKELTAETWNETFDENNSIETPIGHVKMGENQITKFFEKNRAKEFGMVAPTLRNPDVIIEEKSEAKDGVSERPSSFLFVKTFNRNGEKIKFYASITVKQDGMEVSISSHYLNRNKVARAMQDGKVLYTREALLPISSERRLAEHQENDVPDLLPTQGNNASSESKDSKPFPNEQGGNGKIAGAEAEVNTEPTEAQKEAGNNAAREGTEARTEAKGGATRTVRIWTPHRFPDGKQVYKNVEVREDAVPFLQLKPGDKFVKDEMIYTFLGDLGDGIYHISGSEEGDFAVSAEPDMNWSPWFKEHGGNPKVDVLAEEDAAERDAGNNPANVDRQGNPLNADGTLKLDKVGTVDELTDEDFTTPTRNVELPKLPPNVDAAIGADGKPVVVKKNIFEKNKKSHKELSPRQSREILSEALYHPDLYGQNKKTTRPYNWILIHNAEKHSSVILEVSHNKDNVEIVNWHYLDDVSLKQKERQAEKEGGLILTLGSAAGNALGGLSSAGKVTNKEREKQGKGVEFTGKETGGKPRQQKADDVEATAKEYGVDATWLAKYAMAMNGKNSASAERAMRYLKELYLREHIDDVMALKREGVKGLLATKRVYEPIIKAIKEKYGDVDALVEERRKQAEIERGMMEAARKRAEEEARMREVRLEELAQLTDEEIDKRYADALENGDEAAAREMLDEAARRKGYGDAESDYQGVGAWSAPSNPGFATAEERRADVERNGGNVNLDDIAHGYSPVQEEMYSHPERTGFGDEAGIEAGRAINDSLNALKAGKKDVKIKVYRAVPTSVKEGKLRNGDWVTPSRKYAENHGNSRLEGKYRIIEDEVPASELWFDGNDIREWGYDNGKSYRYKNAKNNRKLDDLVTRDDKGNIIPPSKRFNSRKADERYQKAEASEAQVGKREAALRDAVTETMRKAGMEVITDVEEGQRVLDMANGEARMEAKRRSDEAERREKVLRTIDEAMSMVTGKPVAAMRRERRLEEEKIRAERKELYERVLSGNFDEVTLRQIQNYIDNVTPDNPYRRPLSQRLPPKMGRSLHGGTQANHVDVLFGRISESAVGTAGKAVAGARERRQVEEKKKELLKGWAIATGHWHTDISDFAASDIPIGSGKDSDVYLSKDGKYVVKVSKGKEDLKKFAPDIDTVSLFNYVFPNSRYDILGYGEIGGKFVRFLRQPIVDFSDKIPLSAEERVSYMEGLGFHPINKERTAFSNGTIVAADLQKGNIVKDKAGNISVIDADMKLHTKEVGGNYSYPPVERDTDSRLDGVREHRVFHGSGADFDAFDHSHMGEGEGAQAYGWGTYVTEVEGIGRTYAEQNSKMFNHPVVQKMVARMQDAMADGKTFEEAKHEALERMRLSYEKTKGDNEKYRSFNADYEKLEHLTEKDFQSRHLYTVEIPDDTGENYLEWDKEYTQKETDNLLERLFDAANGNDERMEAVQEFSNWLLDDEVRSNDFYRDANGRAIYYKLAECFGGSDQKASGLLHEAGFTGIKYPADYTRGGREDGAKNYVIFNEGDAKITGHVRFFRTPSGAAYGYTVGNRIYIDPRIANSETPIHEYAHLWATVLRKGNEKEWKNVVGLMKGTPLWDEVKKRYPELETDDDVADEVLAHYSGRRGAERLREAQRKALEENRDVTEAAAAVNAIQRVRRALQAFWKCVADFLHIHYTSAEEVADRVMRDLLDGVDPRKVSAKEKAERLQKLRDSAPVEITGQEIAFDEDLKKYKRNALEYGKKLQGEYVNKDTGETINLQRGRKNGGINEVLQHNYKDMEHLQSIAAIPQIIENSVYISSDVNRDKAKNPNVSEYQHYVCGLKIGGKDYTVHSIVAVDNRGNRYYDHNLTHIEKGKLLDLIDKGEAVPGKGFGATPGNKPTTNSEYKYNQLVSILQADSKKLDKIRFQFIGERGAEAADRAEEVNTRLDNLGVAREMEAEKKDAKAIKMATGWERGADGKWRYEIPDSKISATLTMGGKTFDRYESDMLWTEGKLGDCVDAPDLFKAYPELKNIRLSCDELTGDMPAHGGYDSATRTITIHSDELKYTNSILNHEIQHAIQDMEGFARGGNEGMFRDEERIRELESLRDEIEREIANGDTDREERLMEVEDELYDISEDTPGRKYRTLSGEVEARNVQSRMRMSEEERRRSLAAETEDVAREDQIFLYGGDGVREHRVFHGSGADFDAFDHSHMGEGEGAQAYGWGTYVTEVEGIGRTYASISDNDPVARNLLSKKSSAIRFFEKFPTLESFLSDEKIKKDAEHTEKEKIAYYKERKRDLDYFSHHLYTVEIPDDTGENYLEWDGKLPQSIDKDELAGKVMELLSDDMDDIENEMLQRDLSESMDEATTGKGLYNALSLYVGDKRASELLNEAGFVGIKYPADYTSGGREDGAKNYVIFNEADAKITDHVRFRSDESAELEEANEKFNQELERYGKGEMDKNEMFHLGSPKGVMRQFLPDLPIVMRQRIMTKGSVKKHNVDPMNLSDMPKSISRPIFVFQREGNVLGVLTEMKDRDGKNICVAISLNGNIQQGRDVLEVNDIRSVHGRNVEDIVYPIVQNGTLRYADKEKGLAYLSSASRYVQQEIDKQDLLSATNIVENFENPSLSGGKVSGSGAVFSMEDEASRLQETFHTPVRVVRSDSELTDEERRMLDGKRKAAERRGVIPNIKGWFDPKTGEVVVYLPGNEGAADVRRTFLHEVVGHKGLRMLLGEKEYDKEMGRLFGLLPEDERKAVAERAMKRHGGDMAVAMDEYLAEQAEKDELPRWWERAVSAVRGMLWKLGVRVKLTNNDVRYLLWRSRKGLADGVTGYAEDVAMRRKWGIDGEEVRFRDVSLAGEPSLYVTERRTGAAREMYERRLKEVSYKLRESYQDSMLGLKEMMNAIERGTRSRILDFENPYIAENVLSSRNFAEMDDYMERFFKPLLAEVKALTDGGARYEEITDYMFAKHGLERDRLMREREAQMAYDDYRKEHPKGKKTLQDFMDGLAGKDYAGLTALAEGSKSVDRLRQDEETLTNQLRDTYDAPARNALIKQRDGVRRQLMAEARKEAEKMVADFEGKHDADGLWESVNHATKATLAKAYECGLTDKETYEKVKDMYEHYVPLRGFDEVTARDMYDYLNPARTGAGNVMIRAKGRKSKADDPIATIGNMADAAISRGNRNLVKQKFLMMVQNHPTDLANVNHVWLEERKTVDANGNVATEHVAVFPDIPHDATDEEALRMTEQFESDMEARRKAGEALIRADEKPDMLFRIDNKDLEREHQVIVYRTGKPFVVTMNGNPRAAQAVNGATNSDSPDNKVMRMYQKGIRALAGMFTQWNVGFLIPNFVKDGIYANSMVELKEGHAYAMEYHKCWAAAAGNMRGLMKRMENGTLDMNNPIDRMFKEFIDNGGETGYTFMKDVDDYKKLIRKELKTMDSRSRQVWGKALDSLQFYGNMMENVARFSAYMASRNSGRSISRSVFDAKEISVNFNKKGSGMRFAKGEPLLLQAAMLGSAYGRNFIVFWNAGVQGLANILRIANVNKKKFAAVAGSFFSAGFMMPVLQCLLGGDDDDYYDLPEHTRRQNICIKVPGTGYFAKIPLPIELRSLYGLGELCATYALGKENLSASKFALKTAEQLTQVLPVDVVGEGLYAFVPTLIKPVVEVHENRSWTGLPIYRKPYNGKYVPEWKKAYKVTSPLLVGISKKLNEVTGGNDYKKGVIDFNPAKAEHLISGYFGGVGTVANQIMKSAGMIYDEDMRDVHNIPVANRFVQQPSERAKEKRIDGMFYENRDVYEKVKVQLSGFKKEKAASKGNVTEYAEWQKKENDLKKTKEYKIYLVFKNKEKALKKRQDNYNKKGDDATRDVLYELKDEMNREVYEIGK